MKTFSDNCYYLNHNHYTWQEAKEACEFIQSYLTYPNDTDEIQFFHQIGASHGYWLGAKDTVAEGNWTTVKGEPYVGWAIAQYLSKDTGTSNYTTIMYCGFMEGCGLLVYSCT